MKMLAWLVMLISCGCGGGGDGTMPFETIDARCTALCMSSEPTCTADVTECQQQCQLRVADMTSTCTTCLLDHANAGTCTVGQVCCPNATFPNHILDCKDPCSGSVGVNPAQHPVCTDICSSDEPTCSADVTSCMNTCEARVQGVTGLCALCLLDRANGGTCASGQICCPHPQFPAQTSDCTDVCK